MYLRRLPKFLRYFNSHAIYEGKQGDKPSLYLTFDDGPIPTVTEFVLEQLAKVNGKATFFMVGENVFKHPEIFQKVCTQGHSIGNHTYHHLSGFHCSVDTYIEDVEKATSFIPSKLFRPPYGRIKNSQSKALKEMGYEIVLWSLLTGDFDIKLSPQDCWNKIKNNIYPNDIVVLHDSLKSWERLSYILPKIIDWAIYNDWELKALPMVRDDC